MKKVTAYFYPVMRWTMVTMLSVLFILLLIILFRDFRKEFGEITLELILDNITTREFLLFVLVGFVAQIIDGALGMAYGISASAFLMSIGVAPPVASASVHLAEVFTTGVSGLSHLRFGNVNKTLFSKLVIPGIIGAVAGAFVLTSIKTTIIKPIIAIYLIVISIFVIRRAFTGMNGASRTTNISPLGLMGGFMDSIGGGGWGPIVTSTLLGKGHHPRYTIGSVNMAEFFIALSSAGVFTVIMGITNWHVILGLIGGGIVAAPLAAYLCKRINPGKLMLIVATVIILLSIRTLILSFR